MKPAISMTTSPSMPWKLGMTVMFVVTVGTIGGSPTPGGTVSLFDGASSLGFDFLSDNGDGTSSVTFNQTLVSVGGHDYYPIYNGDDNWDATEDTDVIHSTPDVGKGTLTPHIGVDTGLTQVASSTTKTVILPDTNSSGTTIALSGAWLGPPLPVPTGTPQFFIGGNEVTPVSGAWTSVTEWTWGFGAPFPTLGSLPIGFADVTATYAGDSNWESFSVSKNCQVGWQTWITLGYPFTSPPLLEVQRVAAGTLVTLKAVVSVKFPHDPINEAGTVTFKEGATVLGTASMVAGSPPNATITHTFGVGTHIIKAEYSGSGVYWPCATNTSNVISGDALAGQVIVDCSYAFQLSVVSQ
jgi:hypothetical protein